MKIERYSFGEIVINGNKFTSDLKIFPNMIKANWWRKEGHNLLPEDMEDVIQENPEIVIIGTGKLGVMKVSKEFIDLARSNNIQLFIEKTEKAIETFNKLKDKKKVIAVFHLTC